MGKCRLLDYFIKGLCPDEQRGIWGYIKDNLQHSRAKKYAQYQEENYEPCLQDGYCIFDSVDQIKSYMNDYIHHFQAVNDMMLKEGRNPLFVRPENLKESFAYADLLLTFDEESRWNTLLGCNSFEAYEPQTREKGYAILDLYLWKVWSKTKDECIWALAEGRPYDDSVGRRAKNVYEYINLICFEEGVLPPFENVDDEEACAKKAKELLKVRPLKEALAYFGCDALENFHPPKIQG